MNCILWLNSLLQWFLSLWHKFTCVCTIVTYKTCSEDQKIFCFLHTLLCSSCISDEKNQEKKLLKQPIYAFHSNIPTAVTNADMPPTLVALPLSALHPYH